MPQEQVASPERISLAEITTKLMADVESHKDTTEKIVTKEADGTFTSFKLDTKGHSIECTQLDDGAEQWQVVGVQNVSIGKDVWDRYPHATTYKVEAIAHDGKVLLREVVSGLVDGRPHTEKITAETDEQRSPLYDVLIDATQALKAS